MEENYYMVRTRINEDVYAKKGVVAVGWSNVNFSNNIYEIDKLLEEVDNAYYKNSDNIKTGRKKAEIKRFFEIKKGDIIIIPCYKGFYIAKSKGQYIYDESAKMDDLANQLLVDYKKDSKGEILRFSRNDKNTALVSKLRVRGFTVLSIKEPVIQKDISELLKSSEDVSKISRIIDIENNELNIFKESLSKNLSDYTKLSLASGGCGFEKLIAALFETDGFITKVLSKKDGKEDSDADIIAIKNSKLSDEFTIAYFIQAKHHSGNTGLKGLEQIIKYKNNIEKELTVVRNDMTIKTENIKYVLLSSAKFTNDVVNEAENHNIILIDGDRLAEMIFEKIDELNDEYRYQLGYIKNFKHIN